MKTTTLILLAIIVQVTFSTLRVQAAPMKVDPCDFSEEKLNQEWEKHKRKHPKPTSSPEIGEMLRLTWEKNFKKSCKHNAALTSL